MRGLGGEQRLDMEAIWLSEQRLELAAKLQMATCKHAEYSLGVAGRPAHALIMSPVCDRHQVRTSWGGGTRPAMTSAASTSSP